MSTHKVKQLHDFLRTPQYSPPASHEYDLPTSISNLDMGTLNAISECGMVMYIEECILRITELTKGDVFKVVWPLLKNVHQFKSNYTQQRLTSLMGREPLWPEESPCDPPGMVFNNNDWTTFHECDLRTSRSNSAMEPPPVKSNKLLYNWPRN